MAAQSFEDLAGRSEQESMGIGLSGLALFSPKEILNRAGDQALSQGLLFSYKQALGTDLGGFLGNFVMADLDALSLVADFETGDFVGAAVDSISFYYDSQASIYYGMALSGLTPPTSFTFNDLSSVGLTMSMGQPPTTNGGGGFALLLPQMLMTHFGTSS